MTGSSSISPGVPARRRHVNSARLLASLDDHILRDIGLTSDQLRRQRPRTLLDRILAR